MPEVQEGSDLLIMWSNPEYPFSSGVHSSYSHLAKFLVSIIVQSDCALLRLLSLEKDVYRCPEIMIQFSSCSVLITLWHYPKEFPLQETDIYKGRKRVATSLSDLLLKSPCEHVLTAGSIAQRLQCRDYAATTMFVMQCHFRHNWTRQWHPKAKQLSVHTRTSFPVILLSNFWIAAGIKNRSCYSR